MNAALSAATQNTVTFDFIPNAVLTQENANTDQPLPIFGFYMNYIGINENYFIGYNGSSWNWQRYGADAGWGNVSGPSIQTGVTYSVKIQWTGTHLDLFQVGVKGSELTTVMDGTEAGAVMAAGGAGEGFGIRAAYSDWYKSLTSLTVSNFHYSGQTREQTLYPVSGTVTFGGEGVANATVTDGTARAITGSDGSYTLYATETGAKTITASAPGKGSASRSIAIALGGNSDVNIPLDGQVQEYYTLSVIGGHITAPDASGSYVAGTSVTVTADQPDDGYTFTGWTATGLTDIDLAANPLTFVMPSEAVTITANTAKKTYAVVYNFTTNGLIGPAAEILTVEHGKTYIGTLTADSGFAVPDALTSVTMGGQALADTAYTYTPNVDKTTATITIPNVTGDVVITAAAVEDIAPPAVKYAITKGTVEGISETNVTIDKAEAAKDETVTVSVTNVPANASVVVKANGVEAVQVNGESKWTFTMPEEIVTVTVTVTTGGNPQPTTYTVTFNSNGGSTVDAQTVAENGTATKPADPTRDGYTFGGWYTDAAFTTEYDFDTAVTADITLYAKWTEVIAATYTVTFSSNGGSAVDAQTVAENGTANKPADPTRDGYTFDGWYTDEALTEAYDFESPVTADITLYAKWTEEAVNPPAPPAPPTPPTTTETKENEDGTTTTIVTDNRTGTVTETTEKDDGTVEIVETQKDGTVTETTKNTDGSVEVVETKPDGTVTETATDPEGGKVEKVTNPEKDVAITVTDKDGEVLAEVELPAEIPASETRFVDVPEGHWADEAIHNMAALEVVNGIGNDRYDMNGNMTRGALATVLSRLSNGQEGLDSSFADVASDVWYADGIAWAAKTGVVTGYSETEFGPEDSITREQLAVMLCRYARLLGIDTTADTAALNGFNDGSSTHDWAADSIAWCVANGILQGKGNATLAPTATATRAEVAVMLQRFIDLMK